jgi:hypothetical protein
LTRSSIKELDAARGALAEVEEEGGGGKLELAAASAPRDAEPAAEWVAVGCAGVVLEGVKEERLMRQLSASCRLAL